MVLGIKTKSRKNVSIPVDYVINVLEIKPCPLLSQSQKSALSTVFLQWECLGQPPGSFTSEVKDGTIDFSDSFRLSTNLIREASKKSKARESYQKNLVEFFLYEPRKDKPTKGHLLGSTLINLAQYGIIRDTVSVSAPLSCKKIAKNSGQPILYLNIQAIGNEGIDSVSEATGEDEEAELASFTDDDIDDDNSSRSSQTTTSSKGHSSKIEPEISRAEASGKGSSPLPKTSSSPRLLSMGYSFNPRISANDTHVPSDKSAAILKKSATQGVRNSSSSLGYQDNQEKPVIKIPSEPTARVSSVSNFASSSKYSHERSSESHDGSRVTREDDGKVSRTSRNAQEETKLVEPVRGTSRENGRRENLAKKEYSFDVDECRLSPNTGLDDETSTYSGGDMINRLKHVKSAQVSSDASKKDELLDVTEFYPKRIELSRETRSGSGGLLKTTSIGRGDLNENETKNELQLEIERLKDELTEAAAVEVGLYSIVAEHGSSANKMHAPARRIARYYSHACKSGSKTKKANAARTAISGFILVSKACGNDVPRLTFWLSNSIVLRAIISQTIRKPQVYGWQGVSNKIIGKFYGLDEPQNFMGALEKFESWVFSRIVESVWWQTITPHMQPAAAKASTSKKVAGKKNGFGVNEQGNLSIELWKKAFKDSCQRLCPSRAVGHECGCLPVLSRLVMEQLVNRLDVAMFNAILRENGEEMPTDPVSDPISDSKVLPIPAGRSSFGAGVQLKNAIGSWSRCLADIFDIDDGPDEKGEANVEEKPESQAQPFKAFRLLNALSDLMMIPFEMLADETIRKEVCPSLNATLIRMVLCNFVPDEFNPAPIPDEVFEALDSQADGESVTNFPFSASPTVYTPPSATSLTSILGDFGAQSLQKNKSHVLRKSYTSDDELDELDSPFASIIKENLNEKRKSERKVVRYQLLREAWKGNE